MNKFLQDVKPQNSVILSCAITGIYRETVNNKIKFIQKCSSVSLFKLKTNLPQFFCLLPQLNQITSSPFGLLSSVFIFETSKHCSLQEVKYLKVGLKSGVKWILEWIPLEDLDPSQSWIYSNISFKIRLGEITTVLCHTIY